jgi:glycosyltransferase involved in cell wall biosynthesis
MTIRLALVESAAQMGGVQFSTVYLAERLHGAGYEVLVICPAEGELAVCLREKRIPVIIVSQPKLWATSLAVGKRYLPNPIAWAVNLLLLLFISIRLARRLRQQAIDLVCTKGLFAHFYGGLAAKLSHQPCVWHVQDLVSDRAGVLYAATLGTTGRWLATRIIADGTPIKNQLELYYPADRMAVVYNGVDLNTFAPRVNGRLVREEWSVAEAECLIGSVARFTRWKGQRYLVMAFAQLADQFPWAKLALIGAPVFDTADYENELRSLVRRFGLEGRVIFPGYRTDLPQVLAAVDIFVHTSVDKDTSPLAVVSAMASGKPIVSSNVSGVAELFPAGNEAVLVPPADTNALAAALGSLLAEPLRRNELGRRARARAESMLSLDHFVWQCESVFSKALQIA